MPLFAFALCFACVLFFALRFAFFDRGWSRCCALTGLATGLGFPRTGARRGAPFCLAGPPWAGVRFALRFFVYGFLLKRARLEFCIFISIVLPLLWLSSRLPLLARRVLGRFWVLALNSPVNTVFGTDFPGRPGRAFRLVRRMLHLCSFLPRCGFRNSPS